MTQIVIGLTDKLLRVQERVNEEATARHLPWHPAMEARIELSLRHLSTLHTAQTRPVVDPEVADASKQHFDHAAAQVVGDEQIRVDQMQLVDEHFKHLPLILEYFNIRVSLLFDLLLQIEWQRLLVKFSQQSEALELLISRWAILIDLILHDARDHSNLLRVMLRSGHFSRESQ